MISTQMHELERCWTRFAQRHNIRAYDARLMPYDGGQMLFVEVSRGLINSIFAAEERVLNALQECGLELLLPPGDKGASVKMYLIPTA